MTLHPGLPWLTADNYRITSPATFDYNRIAFAANDVEHWWEPDRFWPTAVESDYYELSVLTQAFAGLGYVDCGRDEGLDSGLEKIALYSLGSIYTHAARQLPSGKWTSKLGSWIDIEHNCPDDVAGGIYGEVALIMKRPI
jgi:hypothetical protein